MPKVSKQCATLVEDHALAIEPRGNLDGYEASFVSLHVDCDLAPLLEGLPDDRCPCPHCGYVFKGKLTWRYDDRIEVTRAGDAFYIPVGHTRVGEAGTEFLLFGPAEQMVEVRAVMARNVHRTVPADRSAQSINGLASDTRRQR